MIKKKTTPKTTILEHVLCYPYLISNVYATMPFLIGWCYRPKLNGVLFLQVDLNDFKLMM
jgi:hypothetical protein